MSFRQISHAAPWSGTLVPRRCSTLRGYDSAKLLPRPPLTTGRAIRLEVLRTAGPTVRVPYGAMSVETCADSGRGLPCERGSRRTSDSGSRQMQTCPGPGEAIVEPAAARATAMLHMNVALFGASDAGVYASTVGLVSCDEDGSTWRPVAARIHPRPLTASAAIDSLGPLRWCGDIRNGETISWRSWIP
jgi:hypothetical protein